MIKKVAILANGGDVSGFNAVIRGIVKTAEHHGIECYGFIEGLLVWPISAMLYYFTLAFSSLGTFGTIL